MPLTAEEIRAIRKQFPNLSAVEGTQADTASVGLTRDERDELARMASGAQPATQPQQAADGFQAPFPFDPTDTDLGLKNAARMIGNAPADAFNIAGDLMRVIAGSGEEVARLVGAGPDTPRAQLFRQTASFPFRAIAGSGEAAAHSLGLGPDTPRAQLFRNTVDTVGEAIQNADQGLVERPVSTLFNVSGAMGALGKATGVKTLTQASQATNPVTMGTEATKLGREVAGATGRFTGRAGEFGAHMLTQTPLDVVRKSTRQALGPNRHAFAKQLGSARDVRQVADNLIGAADDLRAVRNAEYLRDLPKLKLKNKNNPINMTDVRQRAIQVLDRHNIRLGVGTKPGHPVLDFENITPTKKRSTINNGSPEAQLIDDVVQQIFRYPDNSIEGVDILKKIVDKRIRRGPDRADFAEANKVVGDIRDAVRKELGDKVQGYNELTGNYETLTGFLNNINKHTNKFDDELISNMEMVQELTRVLRKNPDTGMGKTLIEMLEDISGQPLEAQLAGLAMSGKGSASSSSFASRIVGVGAVSVATSPAFLMVFPFTFPRVIGSLFNALGYSAEKVRAVERVVTNIHRVVPPGMATEGLTFGAVLEQISQGTFQRQEQQAPARSNALDRPIIRGNRHQAARVDQTRRKTQANQAPQGVLFPKDDKDDN